MFIFRRGFEGRGHADPVKFLSTGSDPHRPLFPVAPPVSSLDIVRVIISPGPSHSPRVNVVWNYIAIICKLGATDAAFTMLGDDLFIDQFSHLRFRAEFPVSPWMKCILGTADAGLSNLSCFRNCLPSATGKGSMNRANLVATEPHDFSPVC